MLCFLSDGVMFHASEHAGDGQLTLRSLRIDRRLLDSRRSGELLQASLEQA